MATKTEVRLVDDLDGETPASEAVSFALDGREMEIDLSDENASGMRDTLSRYVNAARKVGGRQATRSSGRRSFSEVDPSAVRAWASSNGHDVSARGRIPAAVIDGVQGCRQLTPLFR